MVSTMKRKKYVALGYGPGRWSVESRNYKLVADRCSEAMAKRIARLLNEDDARRAAK